ITSGLLPTSDGRPSAMIWPSAITTTQSLMSWTTSMSCSTNITVIPSSRSPRMCSRSDCRRAGVTPAIGSSSMTITGEAISARAISSSLRCPPESSPAKSSRMWSSLKRRSSSSARASTSRSCADHIGRTRLRQNDSPRCSFAPSFMLSRTDITASDLVSWKVRTMPSVATRWAGIPWSFRPSNVHLPMSALSNPVRRLNSVVLPAPLGPMSAVTTPRWTSRWSTSTAATPSKRRRTESATRMGSGLATPGSEATPASRSAASAGWCSASGTDRHLPLFAEDAPGAENHQPRKAQADEHQPHLAHLVAHEHRLGDVVGADGLAQRHVGQLEEEPEDHGPDHGPEHAGHAAEQQGRVAEEGERGAVVVGLHRLVDDGEHEAAEGAEDTAEDEALHLVRVDVLAEAAHRVLVLADGLDDAAPRAADQEEGEHARQRHERPAHQQDPGEALVELHHPDAVLARPEGVEVEEAAGEVLQAVRATRGGVVLRGLEDDADDLAGGDGDDGQVVGPQPQRGQAEQQRQHDGGQEADGDAHGEGQLEGGDADREPVGPGGHEGHLAEVEETGVAEVHVEADGGERVDHRVLADGGGHCVLEDELPVHGQPTPPAPPRMPWGRSSRIRIRTTRAPMFFRSGDTQRVETLTNHPTMNDPT